MKSKVLLLQLVIPTYRVPIFNQLGQIVDLTVTYISKDDSPENVSYKREHIVERHFGPLRFHKIRSLCAKFDVVIYMPNIHCISMCLVPFLPHKYKTISYSIGLRASYSTKFDIHRKKNLLDILFGIIQFKGDAVIMYFKEALAFWRVNPKIMNKCFETRNTTAVLSSNIEANNKDSILFVGSLYKGKKVENLIYAYKKAYDNNDAADFPKLEILGGGELFDNLEKLIAKLGLEHKVFMRGAIYDEGMLKTYFITSYACISPNQAGLSVPKSMGYGVPFITLKDAITGGEILHIKNKYNGLLMDSLDELPLVIEDIYHNPDKYILMGKNAKKYYDENASIDLMVKGFSDAISFALNN